MSRQHGENLQRLKEGQDESRYLNSLRKTLKKVLNWKTPDHYGIKNTRLGWKGDPWELCKRLKFDHTKKNGICTKQNPYKKMKRLNFGGILRYKRMT